MGALAYKLTPVDLVLYPTHACHGNKPTCPYQ